MSIDRSNQFYCWFQVVSCFRDYDKCTTFWQSVTRGTSRVNSTVMSLTFICCLCDTSLLKLSSVAGCALRVLPHAQKAKFGFKSDTTVLSSTFSFLSSPLFLLFLCHYFFFCWASSRLHFGGKRFKECYAGNPSEDG